MFIYSGLEFLYLYIHLYGMLKSASSQNFLYGVFSCLVLNELCSATSVLLIAIVTCVMVEAEGISSLTQFKFGRGKEALLSLVHIHVPPVAL